MDIVFYQSSRYLISIKHLSFDELQAIPFIIHLTFFDSMSRDLLPAKSLNHASTAFLVLAVAGQKLSLGVMF